MSMSDNGYDFNRENQIETSLRDTLYKLLKSDYHLADKFAIIVRRMINVHSLIPERKYNKYSFDAGQVCGITLRIIEDEEFRKQDLYDLAYIHDIYKTLD